MLYIRYIDATRPIYRYNTRFHPPSQADGIPEHPIQCSYLFLNLIQTIIPRQLIPRILVIATTLFQILQEWLWEWSYLMFAIYKVLTDIRICRLQIGAGQLPCTLQIIEPYILPTQFSGTFIQYRFYCCRTGQSLGTGTLTNQIMYCIAFAPPFT